MIKKIVPIISITVITILAVVFFIDYNSIDRNLLGQTFVVDAVYYQDDGYVEISFFDKSNKTKTVVLEILGMPESYQKIFSTSQFTDKVQFSSPPQYGWKTNPVTMVVDSEEFGKLGIKTEIHPQEEPPRPIIFSRL